MGFKKPSFFKGFTKKNKNKKPEKSKFKVSVLNTFHHRSRIRILRIFFILKI